MISDVIRLLEVLESADASAVTISDLRQQGVERPGRAVYELRLTGHEIDHVPLRDDDGWPTHGYRLRAAAI